MPWRILVNCLQVRWRTVSLRRLGETRIYQSEIHSAMIYTLCALI